MKSLLRKLYQQGYLEASFTDFIYDEELLTAGLFIGTQWDWANLRYQAADEVILQRSDSGEVLQWKTLPA